ncbi:MAG: hypothetical protein C4294_00080, partial [Nitrospiraceae bacterium]
MPIAHFSLHPPHLSFFFRYSVLLVTLFFPPLPSLKSFSVAAAFETSYKERRLMQQAQQRTLDKSASMAGEGVGTRERQLQPRRYERKAVQIPVRLEMNGDKISCRTGNFSPGGLQLLSEVAPTPGTALDIKFFFGNVCYLNISGQVVFNLDQDDRKISGIKFSPIRDWEQLILLSAVKDFTESPTADSPLLTIVITGDRPALETENIPKYSKRRIDGWKVSPRLSCTHA